MLSSEIKTFKFLQRTKSAREGRKERDVQSTALICLTSISHCRSPMACRAKSPYKCTGERSQRHTIPKWSETCLKKPMSIQKSGWEARKQGPETRGCPSLSSKDRRGV